MDLTAILLTGAVSAFFAAGGAALTLRFALPRVKDSLFDEIDAYIIELPKRIAENPALVHDLLDPVMKELFRGLQAPGGQNAGTFKIPGTNIKLPAEVLTPLIQRFLGNAVKEKATEAVGGLLG